MATRSSNSQSLALLHPQFKRQSVGLWQSGRIAACPRLLALDELPHVCCSPVDVLLCVYVLVAIVITCIRALAAANSPFPAAVWWRTKLEPVLGDGDAYPLMQVAL